MTASSPRGADRSHYAPSLPVKAARRSGRESARVYDSLRKQILQGELTPGLHLSQQSIAAAMGTSNGPVISALRRLAFDGLVTHERSHGYRVCDWGDEKLDDLLTVRRALETEAARLAARRAGSEDIERLQRLVNRMEVVIREERWNEADTVDVEMHVEIARLSRSPGLIEALARCHLMDVVRRRINSKERISGFETLVPGHRRLVDAIASGDPERAAEVMHEHLAGRKPAEN